MTLNLHTLLFKMTSFCNLDCDYCYVRRSNIKRTPKLISQEIISKGICDYIKLAEVGRGTGPNGHWMMFLWHGGEPTLLGVHFFEKILELQRKTGYFDFIINSISSNGTLINNIWADFLKMNRFRVSISIDGPKIINDLHRVFLKGSESSFDSVMKGINVLKRNGNPFGLMCVISEESVKNAEEIFKFFVNNELKRLTFLPRITNESWLSPYEYARFMIRVFDLWLDRGDPEIHIRELENIIHEFLGERAELCEFNGCCGSYLAIDYNGDVYLCDLFIGNNIMKVGNIVKESLKDMLDSTNTIEKVNLKYEMHIDCRKCEYFRICKGGCMYRRSLKSGNHSDKDIYCESRKKIFKHISVRLSDILSCVPQHGGVEVTSSNVSKVGLE